MGDPLAVCPPQGVLFAVEAGGQGLGRLPARLRGQAQQFSLTRRRGEGPALADAQRRQDAVHVGVGPVDPVGLDEDVERVEERAVTGVERVGRGVGGMGEVHRPRVAVQRVHLDALDGRDAR
ncbi:hypothetical protein ACFU6I_11015 [Streptomyces sp. NPDC057486]|uniref:hypothetical protein n=1 Tax=Streptomyces sp. NPDC057486 TaxID=3346145 RepID=UPI0036B3CDEA